MQKYISSIRWKIILISIGLGILFWIADSFIDVFMFHDGTVVSQLFTPGPYEIYVRLLNMSLLLLFGFISQYLISRYKQAGELLRKSEKRYRTLAEAAQDMIFIIDRNDYVQYVNSAAAKQFGLTPVDIIGKKRAELFPPEVSNSQQQSLQRVFESGKAIYIENKIIFPGKELWIGASLVPLNNEAGEVYAVMGVSRDITERRKAEELIKDVSSQWQITFDTIKDGIFIADANGKILRCNKAFANFVDRKESEIVGRTCHEVVHGTADFIDGCPFIATKDTRHREVTELKAGNKWLYVTVDPILNDSGEVISFVHAISDITERRKLEDQLRQWQKMEAIGQLAGGIAHDFNNILTAVIGYATILKMRMGKDEPLKVNLDQILAASEKGANLTQSLLAFSRQQISNPEPVNVNEIIRSMKKLLLRVIGEDIELKIREHEGEFGALTVMADRVQIDQVLINLCTNARDAMPDGGVLTIETARMELDREFITAHGYGKPGTYAVISVSDTGIGIDEKIRERIFEPFYTTREVGKGTGLGLSIVYGIIKQHNSYITCNSEPGKGSTFRICLPISKSEVTETHPEEMPEFESQTATILLAEDELSVRTLTKQILEDSGYKVIEAADGEEAVKIFIETKDRIDLIIFDVIMPKMSGKEAYDRIRKIRPDIKALLTSGYPADFIQKQEIIRQGINFAAKPVSPARLLKKVKETLGK